MFKTSHHNGDLKQKQLFTKKLLSQYLMQYDFYSIFFVMTETNTVKQ